MLFFFIQIRANKKKFESNLLRKFIELRSKVRRYTVGAKNRGRFEVGL